MGLIQANGMKQRIAAAIGGFLVLLGFFMALYQQRSLDFLFCIALLLEGGFELYRFRSAHEPNPYELAAGAVSILFAVIGICNLVKLLPWDLPMVSLPLWAIVSGAARLLAALKMSETMSGCGWLALTSILTVLLGLIMLIFPLIGWFTMSEFVGILLGLMMVLTGIHVLVDVFE